MWILTLIRYIIWKYLLPFSRWSFHFVNSFLLYAKSFWFHIVPFVYFCFCFPCLRRYIQNIYILLRLMSKSILPTNSSRSFMLSDLTLRSLIHFEFILYLVRESSLLWFFCMELSSFPNVIYWRGCLYSIVYSCLLCHRLIDLRCMGLFLGYRFCPID